MARTRRARAAGARDVGDGPLTRDRVVAAALGLLDEVGLEELSMRRLGQRLGIRAASLYWYVRDKRELLELLGDAISAEVRPPAPDMPWRARLEALLWEYRRVLRAHRDAAGVLARTLPTGPHRLRLVDLTLAALLDAGLEGLDAARAGRLLVDYATGFAQEEADAAEQVEGGDGERPGIGGRPSELPPFAGLPAELYPSMARLAPYLADSDGDARFGFGLAVLLDGLDRRRVLGRG